MSEMEDRDYIKFLGTAGTRWVVAKQLRTSGGIWLSLAGTNVHLDPGPGALVKICFSRPRLNPTNLDAIILSHRHLDHSSDVNVLIEAMTEGGRKKRGIVFAPEEALDPDPVILRYLRNHPKEIRILQEKESYQIGNLRLTTPLRLIHHNTQTYGFKFETPPFTLSYIADTKFFPALIEAYRADVIIINLVLSEPKDIDHLNIQNARELIKGISPRLAVLTHFGISMLQAKPWIVAKQIEEETGVKVKAAQDGMRLDLDDI